MREIYMQQGDVVLYKTDSIPKEATDVKLSSNSFVIEKGEGIHTHRLQHPRLHQVLQVKETKDLMYFTTKQEIQLVHEEHGTSVIPQGATLFKVKEREYDYETQEARQVMD